MGVVQIHAPLVELCLKQVSNCVETISRGEVLKALPLQNTLPNTSTGVFYYVSSPIAQAHFGGAMYLTNTQLFNLLIGQRFDKIEFHPFDVRLMCGTLWADGLDPCVPVWWGYKTYAKATV